MARETSLMDAILETIKGVSDRLGARVSALEARAAVPGRDGRDGAPGAPGAQGTAGDPGRDGADGKDGADGRDGLGFDDLTVEYDGERSFSFKFVQGDRVKSFGPFIVPALIYRGVFKAGETYQRGDTVTWAGSLWHASDVTTAKPGDAAPESRAWQLCVKKGADARPVTVSAAPRAGG